MRVIIGNDHAGVDEKEAVARLLASLGHEAVNVGTDTRDSVDYPDIAREVATKVVAGNGELGVLLCGTGIGVSIAANKVAGARAAVCHSEATARLAREHNDANILCLGARVLDSETIAACVAAFVATPFEGGRHARRVDKIKSSEGGGSVGA